MAAENSPEPVPAEQSILITRVFDARRELVFKTWTEPDRLKRWWGPKGFTAPVCKVDLRPGGAYHNCMRSPEGKDYWSTGVYREVVVPERIVCTDCFADAQGNPAPATQYGMSAEWPMEALITVTFEEAAGKTKLTLCHSIGPAPTDEIEMCRQGWSESFDKLAEVLAKA